MDKSQWQISDRFIVMLAILFGVVFLAMLILLMLSRGGEGKVARVRLDERALSESINQYNLVFGSCPTGGNSNVVNVLTRDNPQKIVFLNFRRTAAHPNEMVDPWETPYQIEFLQQTNFIVRSAGKDKVFGDKDDIIFDSRSTDF